MNHIVTMQKSKRSPDLTSTYQVPFRTRYHYHALCMTFQCPTLPPFFCTTHVHEIPKLFLYNEFWATMYIAFHSLSSVYLNFFISFFQGGDPRHIFGNHKYTLYYVNLRNFDFPGGVRPMPSPFPTSFPSRSAHAWPTCKTKLFVKKYTARVIPFFSI